MSNDDFEIGGEREKLPYVSLKDEGDEFEGKILDRMKVQDYSFGPDGEPLFWGKNGKKVTEPNDQPVMVTVLVVETPEGPSRLFIKGSLYTAFVKLAEETGEPVKFEVGGRVKIRRGKKGGGKYGNDVDYRVKATRAEVSIGADSPATSTKEEIPF